MAGILILVLLVVVVAVVAALGFIVGYFVGRRSAAREHQVGFPVMPPDPDRAMKM